MAFLWSSLDVFRHKVAKCVGVTLGTYVLAILISSYIRRRCFAPGPFRLPLVGNALQVPAKLAFIVLTKWSEEYGPMYSLNLAGQEVVVLSSHKVARDLLDRRSNVYSGRGRLIMANEILGGGIFFPFLGYNAQWRKMRRAAHESFSARAAKRYQQTQTQAAIRTAMRILNDTRSWQEYIEKGTVSTLLSVIYGWSLDNPEEGPLLQRMHDHAKVITGAALPGSYLVDLIPVLNYVPSWLASWKKWGLKWHDNETELFEGFVADAINCTCTCDTRPSFAMDLGQNRERYGLSTKEVAWLTGIMFVAGSETITSVFRNFILAMVLYPETMCKAQAEIDAIVGRERTPNFEDQEALLYIQALIRELMRWRPVGPLGVPHMTTEADVYEGYLIPKDTLIISNIWAMNRDPDVYPDFEEFRPERFLDQTGKHPVVPENTRMMGHVSFGFGRRICVGMDYAEQTLFITIATLLWALDIRASCDATGSTVKPSATAWEDTGLAVAPAPFSCTLHPRFPEVHTILAAMKHTY